MNPDSHNPPWPRDPEARLTAFLLGELPPAEAVELERELGHNPELARLHRQLASTIELVREVVRRPEAQVASPAAQAHLSEDRRARLLTVFKTLRAHRERRAWWNPLERLRSRPALALAASVALLLAAGGFYLRLANQRARMSTEVARLEGEQLSRMNRPLAEQLADGVTVVAGQESARSGVSRAALVSGPQGAAVADRSEPEVTSLFGTPQGADNLASAPGAQGGAAPMGDIRLMMRYGLTPRGSSLAREPSAPAAAPASLPTPAAGEPAAEGKRAATPAPEPLRAWYELATNRARDGDVVNGALGYAFQSDAGNTARGYGGFGGFGGGLAAGGGFGGGGFGGGGMGGTATVGAGEEAQAAVGESARSAGRQMWALAAGPRPLPEAGAAADAPTAQREASKPEPRSERLAAGSWIRSSPARPELEGLVRNEPTDVKQRVESFDVAVEEPAVTFAPSAESSRRARDPAQAEPAAVPTIAGAPVAATGLAGGSGGAAALGDVPSLGRMFRGDRAGEPTALGIEVEAPTASNHALRARGRFPAAASDVRQHVEELAPVPLTLPVPASVGTPIDIPLEAGLAAARSKDKASLDMARETDYLPLLGDSVGAVAANRRLGVEAEAAPSPERRTPGQVAAGKPPAPPTVDLYFRESADGSEERQRELGEGQVLERYDEAILSKGVLALREEARLDEAMGQAAGPAPARSSQAGRQVDELRRKASPLASVDDLAVKEEEAKRQAGVEKLAELKQLADLDGREVPADQELVERERGVRLANRPQTPPPVPQPEVLTAENNFSTFSLNVADVSFKLAAASLEAGNLPDPASIRVEEFVNAFDYYDPEPVGDAPVAFAWERAVYPFAHNREVLRFSVQTAAQGREPGRALNLVLLLDNSGSMERADRVHIIREALHALGGQLQPQDKLSVVAFARNARLWVDGLPGSEAGTLPERVGNLTPEGGTNLEEALRTAYDTARRNYLSEGVNRVILLTDGAANLGDVSPESLKRMVEEQRRRGVALDCFGIGWEGYNDDLLETLSRNGDGRYGFVNTPEEAASGFAQQLAGALQVAAADVKAQVEFNPARVTTWRQIGYAKHQLTKEQFRDNTVDAAELGAAESGNALYVVEVNSQGQGPLGIMRVRYRVPATGRYREHEWALAYEGPAVSQERASASMRLATAAAAFGEMLSNSPHAAEVNSGALLAMLGEVPRVFAPDPRPAHFEGMLRQAQAIGGR